MTGYTECITKGATFKEFALQCARNFGALVSLRDEPLNSEIPDEISPSPYYKEQLNKALQNKIELESLSEGECEEKALIEYRRRKDQLILQISEKDELKEKLENILEQIENYQPPSPEHENFKKFMHQQVTDTIQFDCSDYHVNQLQQLQLLSGESWREQELQSLNRDIEYYGKQHREEKAMAESRTLWIRQLKESLS